MLCPRGVAYVPNRLNKVGQRHHLGILMDITVISVPAQWPGAQRACSTTPRLLTVTVANEFQLSLPSVSRSKTDLLLLQRHFAECDEASGPFSVVRRVATAIDAFVGARFLSSVFIFGGIVTLVCLAVH